MTVSTAAVVAQEQVTEAQVGREKLFIEANREKLLGNAERAIALYGQILKEDARNHAAAFELGRLYAVAEDYVEGIRYLRMATELDPTNEWYPRYLADLYQATGRNQEGANLYASLVNRYPDQIQLYYKWAFFLVKAQQIDRAIEVYQQLETRIGINEECSRRKHALYLGQGDIKRAARELENLAAAFPQQTEYRYLLAGFYESTGDVGNARRTYQAILAINPNDAKAQLALSSGQSTTQQDEHRYLASLEPIFNRDDVDLDLKIGKLMPFIAKVAENQDTSLAAAALRLTDILERVHPGQAKPLAAAGDLLFHAGRHSEALQKYRATLQIDKSVFPVWEQYFHLLYIGGELLELRSATEKALDLFPNKVAAYYYAALANCGLAAYEPAYDMLDQALLITGRGNDQLRGQLSALLGQIYGGLANPSNAETAFAEALRLQPNSPEVGHRYALFLQEQGQPAEALRRAQAAVTADPNNFLYRVSLAQVWFKQEKYPQAATELDAAMKMGAAQWPQALELLGDIRYQLGDTDAALDLWTQARERGIQTAILQKKITNRQWYE